MTNIEAQFDPKKLRKTTLQEEEVLKSRYIASLTIAQRWAILEETRKRIFGEKYHEHPPQLKLTIIRGKKDAE